MAIERRQIWYFLLIVLFQFDFNFSNDRLFLFDEPNGIKNYWVIHSQLNYVWNLTVNKLEEKDYQTSIELQL